MLLASASIFTSGQTIFVATPPCIDPIFAVVSSSILSRFIFEIALLATLIALIPFSGATPACAAFPIISTSILSWAGPLLIIVPTSSPESNTNPLFDSILV